MWVVGRRPTPELTGPEIGMLVVGYLLLLPLAYLYLVSGLVVPTPWLVPMWIAMVALIVLAIRWWRRPLLVLVLPVAGLGFWFAYVQGLGTLFDWTA
jgi:hypothetical protein